MIGVPCPDDYEDPNWELASKVMDWRNYIVPDVQEIWATFTTEQKKALALNANYFAYREEWD